MIAVMLSSGEAGLEPQEAPCEGSGKAVMAIPAIEACQLDSFLADELAEAVQPFRNARYFVMPPDEVIQSSCCIYRDEKSLHLR